MSGSTHIIRHHVINTVQLILTDMFDINQKDHSMSEVQVFLSTFVAACQ